MSEPLPNGRADLEGAAPQVSALDALSYIYHLSREMAAMADGHGLSRLAAALELSRSLAAEALALLAIQSRSGNAAADEAT